MGRFTESGSTACTSSAAIRSPPVQRPSGASSPLIHTRTVQGTYSSIRSERPKWHYQWWVLEAWDPDLPTADRPAGSTPSKLAAPFPGALPQLVAATEAEPLPTVADPRPHSRSTQWSTGRITLAGDAAHATSPVRGLRRRDVHQRRLLPRAGRSLASTSATPRLLPHALLTYEQPDESSTPPRRSSRPTSSGKVFHHTPALLATGQRLRPRPHPPACRSRWANAVRARSSPNSTRWAKESPRAGNDASTDERRGRMQG